MSSAQKHVKQSDGSFHEGASVQRRQAGVHLRGDSSREEPPHLINLEQHVRNTSISLWYDSNDSLDSLL